MHFKYSKILKLLSSGKFTIVLFLLLIILVLAGTIQEKYIGLYKVQEEYFNSIITNIIIPFPGGITLFSLLSLNLLNSIMFKFKWKLTNIPLLVVHFAILLLIGGSFFTFLLSKKGVLILKEGEMKNFYGSYNNYELVITDITSSEYDRFLVFPDALIRNKSILQVKDFPLKIQVYNFYSKCVAWESNDNRNTGVFSNYKINLRKAKENNKEAYAGCILEVYDKVKLIGKISIPQNFEVKFLYHNNVYKLLLRPQRNELPFYLKLIKFKQQLYPGTEIAYHFESRIEIINKSIHLQALIKMNHPLRYGGYTFYQSSFNLTKEKTESILAVVYNPARYWLYCSSILIISGMLVHFLLKFKVVHHK